VCAVPDSRQCWHKNCVMDGALGVGSLFFEYPNEAVAGFGRD
jgi:hypothetical protein